MELSRLDTNLTMTFTFVFYYIGANSTQQHNLPHHKRLFNDLMASYGSTSVRPVIDSNKPIQVRFYFKPFILSEFVSICLFTFLSFFSSEGFLCLFFKTKLTKRFVINLIDQKYSHFTNKV